MAVGHQAWAPGSALAPTSQDIKPCACGLPSGDGPAPAPDTPPASPRPPARACCSTPLPASPPMPINGFLPSPSKAISSPQSAALLPESESEHKVHGANGFLDRLQEWTGSGPVALSSPPCSAPGQVKDAIPCHAGSKGECSDRALPKTMWCNGHVGMHSTLDDPMHIQLLRECGNRVPCSENGFGAHSDRTGPVQAGDASFQSSQPLSAAHAALPVLPTPVELPLQLVPLCSYQPPPPHLGRYSEQDRNVLQPEPSQPHDSTGSLPQHSMLGVCRAGIILGKGHVIEPQGPAEVPSEAAYKGLCSATTHAPFSSECSMNAKDEPVSDGLMPALVSTASQTPTGATAASPLSAKELTGSDSTPRRTALASITREAEKGYTIRRCAQV